MVVNEDDAKKYVCSNQSDHMEFCVGSYCMAWRFFSKSSKSREGYCGLAGKPVTIKK